MHYHDPLGFPLTAAPRWPGDPWADRAAAVYDAVSALGFGTFGRLAEHVRALPVARTTRPDDPMAVLHERCGTGSAKHRLLATVAQGGGHFEVMLTLGIYAMSEANSPGVGAVLEAAAQSSIPATRCYLTIDHQRFDFTGDVRGTDTPFMALSAEYFLSPDALAEREGPLHRQALTHWAELHGLSEHAAWALHLACSAARDRTADAPPIPARR